MIYDIFLATSVTKMLDHYIFTVTRMDAWGMSTWFMCTPQAAEKLIAMDYDNLAIQETTIVG